MALITPTLVSAPRNDVLMYEWTPMTEADTFQSIQFPQKPDKTFVATGTFGTGGDIRVQGSLDNTNFFDLTDPQGNVITLTAAGLETVLQNVFWIRPDINAGTGVSVTVRILG